jgi:hypothetical protein
MDDNVMNMYSRFWYDLLKITTVPFAFWIRIVENDPKWKQHKHIFVMK